AFRQAGKAHGLSDEQVSTLLTHLDEKVDDLLLESAALPRGSRPSDPAPPGFPLEPERWPRLLADARRLLGRPQYLSLPPRGGVIPPQRVEDYVPLQWAARGVAMTQFDKEGVERIGLVKIALLGTRALATVDEARRHAGTAVPPQTDGDPPTVALLRRGDTLGITQLD